MEWFTTGSRNSLKDIQKSQMMPDQPVCRVEIVTEATVQWVEEFIRPDMRIMIYSVVTTLGCAHGLAYRIMHDHLKFRKVCIWWVRRKLKD
jgi:hypothetical protein